MVATVGGGALFLSNRPLSLDEFTARMNGACARATEVKEVASDLPDPASQRQWYRSFELLNEAIHADPPPAEAAEMVDAFDLFFDLAGRMFEQLELADAHLAQLKVAMETDDRALYLEHRGPAEDAIDAGEAALLEARPHYRSFLGEAKALGITNCPDNL